MKDDLKKIFSEIHDHYELVNHVVTFGLDRLWRRRATEIAAGGGGDRWLDICSGTGEMALALRKAAPEYASIYATDFSIPMVSRARSKRGSEDISYSISDVSSLPFADSTFDLVTCSFGMRNLNTSREDFLDAMREVRRVLKAGGRFASLETSQPGNALARFIFRAYVKLFIEPVGTALTGSRAGYRYLADSMQRFYGAHELEELLLEAGYRGVASKRLMLGAVAVHLAVR